MALVLKSVLTFCGMVLCMGLDAAYAGSKPLSLKENGVKHIHIGIYAPFSDDEAFIGRDILGAMEMARDELKASKVRYSFYTLDTHTGGNHSKATVEQFIRTHHIQVLVTQSAQNGLQLAKIARENKLIHFSMAQHPAIADGKNNFLVSNPAYEQSYVPDKNLKQAKDLREDASNRLLTQTLMQKLNPEFSKHYQQAYMNYPVTQAGFAYDMFHILNQSILMAMKVNSHFAIEDVATQIHVLAVGNGVMGHFNLDNKGILYGQSDKKYLKNKEQVIG